MVTVTTEASLRNLRSGDRLKYHGVEWQVRDYSTYEDSNGYQTEEWLLSSSTQKEYYLLREIDPQNSSLVNWYLAEELRQPTLIEPESKRDVLASIWEVMQQQQTPYGKLQLFNRVYSFESETEGTYESEDGTSNRVTWDYWDDTHVWNLALEAWKDGTLAVYSTRKVQPSDFSVAHSNGQSPVLQGFRAGTRSRNRLLQSESRSFQLLMAWFITALGVILMLAGF